MDNIISNTENFQNWIDTFSEWKKYIEQLEKENHSLKLSRDFYRQRCELLQKAQKYMNDPERTIVCDILANGTLLPDPEGKRYGHDILPEIKIKYFPDDLLDLLKRSES